MSEHFLRDFVIVVGNASGDGFQIGSTTQNCQIDRKHNTQLLSARTSARDHNAQNKLKKHNNNIQ